MKDKSKFRSKKVIIFSSLSLFFGSLSLISYNWKENIDITHQEPALVLIDQNPIDKIEVIDKTNVLSASSEITPNKKGDQKSNKIKEKNILLLGNLKSNYIIVIGTFSERNNAINFYNSSINKGYKNCKIIYNGTSLYWVSFNFYDLVKDAKKDIANYNLDGWIKKLKN